MAINDRIAVDPKIMQGKPVVKGTRIPVGLDLTADDLRAATTFATRR